MACGNLFVETGAAAPVSTRSGFYDASAAVSALNPWLPNCAS
jgi:hypothetical protein